MAGQLHNNQLTLPENLKRVECPEPVEGLSFIYILYCRNGSFYIGQSQDVARRLERHKNGSGARHIKQLKEFELIFTEGPLEPSVAATREKQLKKWSRAKKIALITGNQTELRKLSQSRD